MNNSNIFLLFFSADVGACFADYTVTDRNPSQAFKPQLPAVVIIEVNLKRHLTLKYGFCNKSFRKDQLNPS